MRRDVSRLTSRTFDVLVVGGGISGLTIACDAAERGLSVALIERDDFGSGISFNHLRTIHGGLRYLQHGDMRRARASMRERRTLARIAPFALRPQPFVLPLTRSLLRGRLAMRSGFLLDSVIGAGRNSGVPALLALPPGRIVSRAEAIERYPALSRQGLTGAAVWYEYATTEADRLTIAWALAAAKHGATLANHVEATGVLGDAGRVEGIAAVDRLSNAQLEIASRLTINAAGASRSVLAPNGSVPPLLRAMNFVTRRDAGEEAIGARTASGRHLFLVPWRRRALFGTWESPGICSPENRDPSADDLGQFIRELNEAFPSLDLTPSDVTLIHQGLVPAVDRGGGVIALDGHDRVIDHAWSSPPIAGLLTVAATKYTTARSLAEHTVDLALKKLNQPAIACRTAITHLPGGGLGDTAEAVAVARRDYEGQLPSQTIPHLVAAYGSRYGDVAMLAASREEWRSLLSHDSPVVGGQLIHAARQEMAVTLADAVVRRTPLGVLGLPDDAVLTRAAVLMATECSWDDERRQREIAGVRDFYTLRAHLVR
jgi:glycerol-3-phosphate dehydrogenase